jgi:2'-5' RNA ligase
MAFALEMYFDSESDRTLRAIWEELARAGVSTVMRDGGYRPHVSLAVAAEVDAAAMAADLAAYAATAPPLSLLLSYVGIFPGTEGVVYLGAVAASKLLKVHAAVYRLWRRHTLQRWEYYAPGQWVPHCTMAFMLPLSRIAAAAGICLRAPLPLEVRVTHVGLVQVSVEHYEELLICPWGS